jgi:hypothetical protein
VLIDDVVRNLLCLQSLGRKFLNLNIRTKTSGAEREDVHSMP